jgi:3',5'-cyclic AMP phosphodiesterase CpdA
MSMPAQTTRDAPSVTIPRISGTQFGQCHRFDSPDSNSLAAYLVRDLKQLVNRDVPSIDLVALSGDIAEKGLKGEHRQALPLIKEILGHTGIGAERVVMAPGNHDVNWALSEAHFADCRGDEIEPRAPYAKK